MRATAPCKECTERHEGCHGTCKEYIAFKNAKAIENEVINCERTKIMNHLGFIKQQRDKQRRAHR